MIRLCSSFFVSALLTVSLVNCKQPIEDDSKTTGPQFNENIRPTDPRTAEDERLGFILPPGFEIQLFASEPDIDKPINMTFDAKGRLWVTQSFEYPFPAAPGSKGTDRLSILEDTDGDGKADRFTHFSDTLNIPIGVLPVEDGAIAFSVPNVYHFIDANGDGKPERREIMLGPFGYQDTHGMVSNFLRGYDGWVHACHGFTNRSDFAGRDGDSIHLVSGNTFRFRMDGSRVEQVTFGQVNPFGLVYDRYGYIYSTDSHSSPLHQLITGGDYPHFGKVEIMGFAPDMKSLSTEATALCGITCYEDVRYPEEFRGNFFIGDVVNSRVHRYSSTWRGSTPVGKSETDFIKSEDPWFRPVNIKLGPDGALYVADFYNAIIGHYEVPLDHPKRDKHRGRIWRITYKGRDKKRMDLSKADAEQLIAALDEDNLTIRMAATDQLTDRLGASSVDALKSKLNDKNTPARVYIHSLWALHRLNVLDGEMLKRSVENADPLIRLHALRVLAERKQEDGYLEWIVKSLGDPDPHVQRAAVELLQKYPTLSSIESLLAILNTLPKGVDTHLIYTARLGLRNILRHEDVLKQVVAKSWNEKDAGFIAGVMVDVPLPESADFLVAYMSHYPLPPERIPSAYRQIARFIPAGQLEKVIAGALQNKSDSVMQRSMNFKGLQEGLSQRAVTTSPAVFAKWAPALAEELLIKFPPNDLTDSDEKVLHQRIAIDIAGDYKVSPLEGALKGFLEQGSKLGMGIRNAALRSLLKIDLEGNAALGGVIIEKDSMIEYQRRTAGVLAEFPGKAVNKVLNDVKKIPVALQGPVIVALAGSADGKDIIFQKVRRGELLPRSMMEPRAEERILMNASARQQKEFADITATVDPINKEKQELIDKRIAHFEGLDKKQMSLDSGRAVFDQNCGVCHKLGGTMGVAPQLNGIGRTGVRGITEKILDPNRNISQAFRNYTIKLKDGTVRSGLYRREEGSVKIFADVTGKEFSVRTADIAGQKASKYTLMPDSFASTISEKEFYNLVNYLMSL